MYNLMHLPEVLVVLTSQYFSIAFPTDSFLAVYKTGSRWWCCVSTCFNIRHEIEPLYSCTGCSLRDGGLIKMVLTGQNKIKEYLNFKN
jgi:hypothetical protein